ncbi:MAG: hypothetical protein U0441_16915 [Polyangiaceae bacterium]
MGSQYLDLHLVDPALVQARLRGDLPDLVASLYGGEGAPDPALRPAFELMARGTFVFLPKGREHPEGHLHARAVEHLLTTLGKKKWCLEYYPDESEYPLWELGYGKCDAEWLDVPNPEHGIPLVRWRSPDTCRSLRGAIERSLERGDYNARYSPEASLREAVAALSEGASSRHGLFAVYQG